MLLLPYLYAQAKPGAEPGTSGDVTVTVTMAGHTAGVATAKLTVAHDVDLAVAVPGDPVAGERGKPVRVPLEVRNLGERAVPGVALRIVASQGLKSSGNWSNCGYDRDQLQFCRFDEKIEPGTTYVLSDPAIAVRDDAVAGTGRFSAILLTGDEFDQGNFFDQFTRGTGGVLHLVPKPSAARKAPTVDSHGENNLAFGSVTIPAAPATPAPTPSATAAAPGGTGGGDGGLPITGAPVAVIAGAGLVLLLLGGLGVRVARRRRFIA